MKIVLQNIDFTFDNGCRLLKLKYENCPQQFESVLGDIWDDIVPMSFMDIVKNLNNIEQRRVGINFLGLERISNEVDPLLVGRETIKKSTIWVNSSGEMVSRDFNDTYELYRVEAKKWGEGLGNGRLNDVFFVKCKDTSTDREYYIWVDDNSVRSTNREDTFKFNYGITPIQAIAWTIQTDIPIGGIELIVRQGDCVLIKPKTEKRVRVRHLTEKEYRELLVLES